MKRNYIKMDNCDESPNKLALVERNYMPQGLQLVDPDAVAKSSKQDLVALAAEIQKADNFIKANACNKLHMIVRQMKFLQTEAENILLEANSNMKLHHAACNFVKQPGQIYHLYERESGQCYFSMLNPEEWGTSNPTQTYKGSYRLEHDHSWTPISNVHAKDNELNMCNKLLSDNVINNSFNAFTLDIDKK